jgi:hypothetical protein
MIPVLRVIKSNKHRNLLLVLVSLFFVFPFIENMKTEISLVTLVFFAVVLATFKTIKVDPRISKWFWVFGINAFILDVVLWLYAPGIVRHVVITIFLLTYSGFLLFSLILMIQDIFADDKVTPDTICAGISIYLLIGFLWTLFYDIVHFIDKNAFHYAGVRDSVSLMYFSFTTLTTVGYGDIYPVNKIAMSLSNLEAISGQIYLGVFVARLIGLHLISSKKV